MFHAASAKVPPMSYFTRHLDSVGEGYLEHARHALGFSAQLLVGGLVCLVHAVFPFLFERTGSDIIRGLHDRMVVNRRKASAQTRRSLDALHESATAPR